MKTLLHAWADTAKNNSVKRQYRHWFSSVTQQRTTRSSTNEDTSSRLGRHSKEQLGQTLLSSVAFVHCCCRWYWVCCSQHHRSRPPHKIKHVSFCRRVSCILEIRSDCELNATRKWHCSVVQRVNGSKALI